MVNKKHKRIYRLARFLLITICLVFVAVYMYAGDSADAKNNYFRLREMFIAWDEGFPGSRAYRKKQLNSYLVDLLGQEIMTDYDFLIDPKWITGEGKFSSDLIYNKWLYIHGSMDADLKDEKLPGFGELLREREIKKTLFAVSGKIRKFSLEESSRGRSVHLFLERLRIEPLKK